VICNAAYPPLSVMAGPTVHITSSGHPWHSSPALTPRVSPQQERGASLVMAWACADTGESVPGFGPNSEGRAVVAGAVPAPRYGGPLRMARDTDLAYGSRIADRRGRLIEGLIASRQRAGHVASRLGELTTRERQRSSSALNRPPICRPMTND
jgi:hypothetical protein